jgi:uncharacterized protein HemX
MNKTHAISTLAMALVILLGCVVYSFHRISETAVLHQAEVASLQEQIVPAPAEDEALSHMKVFTIIGNDIYYIEPQTGEINKSRFSLDK